MAMEYIVKDTLEKSPETTLAKYPILRVAYREDGTRKELEELFQDRERMIERGEIEEETNKLLLTILESRETSKEEMLQQLDIIGEEIYKKGIESGFEYDLLKRTLQRGGITEERAEEYIETVKSLHKERRRVEEAEKTQEENTPKTIERKAQMPQEVQWMEAMKEASDRVTEFEGYSKRQEEIVQEISAAEKQKESQRTDSVYNENTQK